MNCCSDHKKHKDVDQAVVSTADNKKRGIVHFVKNNLIWICLAGIVVFFLAVRTFNLSLGSILPWGVFLLCPLMHVFMMKNHGGHEGHEEHKEEKSKE